MEPEALSPDEAAEFCGVSRSKWFEMAAHGETPQSFKVGGKRKWLRSSLLSWLKATERSGEDQGFRLRQRRFINEFCVRYGVRRRDFRRLLLKISFDDFGIMLHAKGGHRPFLATAAAAMRAGKPPSVPEYATLHYHRKQQREKQSEN